VALMVYFSGALGKSNVAPGVLAGGYWMDRRWKSGWASSWIGLSPFYHGLQHILLALQVAGTAIWARRQESRWDSLLGII
jgi:hypothetical protein